MQQRLVLVVFVCTLISLTACQSYTTGLEKSLARADETVAIGALRTIAIAERTYTITNEGRYGTLQQLSDGGFINAKLASSTPIKDYSLTLNVIPNGFTCNADPLKAGGLAGRHFYIDAVSSEIHVNDTEPATAADKTLQ